MNEKKGLTAGQFAQMLHIDRHLLDKYDEIGLFQPNFRENNGHKWYTLNQVNDWQLVTGLLAFGMQPSELQDWSEEGLLALWREQQSRIDATISRLTMLQNNLKGALGQAAAMAEVDFDVVTEIEMPVLGLIETPITQDLNETMVVHLSRWYQNDIHKGPLVLGQRFTRLKKTDQPAAVFNMVKEANQSQVDKQLASGRYLCVYHRGMASVTQAFELLNNYAVKHDWQLADDYLVLPIQTQLTESLSQTEFAKIIIYVRS